MSIICLRKQSKECIRNIRKPEGDNWPLTPPSGQLFIRKFRRPSVQMMAKPSIQWCRTSKCQSEKSKLRWAHTHNTWLSIQKARRQRAGSNHNNSADRRDIISKCARVHVGSVWSIQIRKEDEQCSELVWEEQLNTATKHTQRAREKYCRLSQTKPVVFITVSR